VAKAVPKELIEGLHRHDLKTEVGALAGNVAPAAIVGEGKGAQAMDRDAETTQNAPIHRGATLAATEWCVTPLEH